MTNLQKPTLKSQKFTIEMTENSKNCHKETHKVTRMFRQFDELRNKINEEKEYFIKETETIKKKGRNS